MLLLVPLIAATVPALADGGFDCRCLYRGQYFEQGVTVCIRVDGRNRLARCEMSLNNSSWTFLKDGCPTAQATPIPEAMRARFAAR
jgi:hypothetical protein